MSERIYLDHNATAPILPEVADAIAECYARRLANPASLHSDGQAARRVLEDAREGLAELLGASKHRLIFTSGGTEANNLAIYGLSAIGGPNRRIAISSIEHPCISQPAEDLEHRDSTVDRIAVTADGVVDESHFAEVLSLGPVLASVTHANHETGVIQPVQRLAQQCRDAGVEFHTDASQSVGKIPVDFEALGVSAMTVSAHKFHGPPGIGALIVRSDLTPAPLLRGGAQQFGVRPGTEPVALAVGMHVALKMACDGLIERAAQLRAMRDEFEARLLAECPQIVINGRGAERLPHVSNIAFPGADRQAMLIALDIAGISCSAGAACASGSTEPSPTLAAMGLPKSLLDGSLRFSFGRWNDPAQVDRAVGLISRIYSDLSRPFEGRKSVSARSR